MHVKVDLIRERFDSYNTVNFYDGKTIFFEPIHILPTTVSFKVWGVGLMPGFDWGHYINFEEAQGLKFSKSQTNEVTIQGFSTITIFDVVAGKVSICPYDKGTFLKRKDGKNVEFKREWSLEAVDNECYEYRFDTNIFFPYGGCDVKLYAKGSVVFEFNTDDCVNGINYITNPNRQDTFWGYLKDSVLCTNSYQYEDIDPLKHSS